MQSIDAFSLCTVYFHLCLLPVCCCCRFRLLLRVLLQFEPLMMPPATTQDYAGQSLALAEFSNARLEAANFSGADLRGAVFNGSSLKNANLRGVDFTDGIAYITDFAGADLSDAIFNSAMMLKSNFQGATVTGADFTAALLDRDQALALCKTASGTNPLTGEDTRDSLGCP
jgi:uncharacterized protein YjbI with pentapeptide repeats